MEESLTLPQQWRLSYDSMLRLLSGVRFPPSAIQEPEPRVGTLFYLLFLSRE